MAVHANPLVTWAEINTSGMKGTGTIVEDLRNFITNTSAVDRPALALLKKSQVRTAYVEWNEDTLAARGHNAAVEGAGSTQPNMTMPTRNTASVQTFAEWGQVSDLQSAVEHVGMEDMYLYQESKAVKKVLNDIEHAIHRGSMITGVSGTARQMGGFLNILSTNMTASSGTTMNEEVFGDLLQLFVDGGTEIRPSVVFVNSYLKRTISNYSLKVTRNIEAAARTQMLTVDYYTSDFGELMVYYSRDQLKSVTKSGVGSHGNSIVIIDPSYFELGWLRTLLSETLARDGLRQQFQISAMMTLIYRSEKGGGGGTGLVGYLPSPA